MKKVSIANIILIATHRCNLECAHCMRGDADNSIMSDEVLEAIFKNISTIGNLTISGGEPLLAPSVIKKIYKGSTKIKNFHIITNGTIYNDQIFDFIRLLNKKTIYDGNSINISEDKYHTQELIAKKIMQQYIEVNKTIEEFCNKNNMNFSYHNIGDSIIINEGRAENLHGEKIISSYNYYRSLRYDEDYKRYLNTFTIDVDGDICIAGDISYENIKKISLGKIQDGSLYFKLKDQYQKQYKERG